jgi:hypothetical protein
VAPIDAIQTIEARREDMRDSMQESAIDSNLLREQPTGPPLSCRPDDGAASKECRSRSDDWSPLRAAIDKRQVPGAIGKLTITTP